MGVEPRAESDCVIVTDSGRTVTVYKVSDQKPLGSWTVKQGQVITSPAVYIAKTGEYVVVYDHKVLRLWKDEDVNLEKTFKATLSAKVHRVHTLPDTETVVLFTQGAVRPLDVLLEIPQQEIENVTSEEEVIRWSDFFLEDQTPFIIFITEKSSGHLIYVHNLNSNIMCTYKIDMRGKEGDLLNFTASLRNKMISITTLSSSGCIFNIIVPVYQKIPEHQCLPKSLVLKLPESDNLVIPTAVKVLNEAHIVVLGTPQTQESASKGYLHIWNVKFQTLQSSKELFGGNCGQLWCNEDKLYVPHRKTLTVIPYQSEPSSLAVALGRQKHSKTMDGSSAVDWNAMLYNCQDPAQMHPASAELQPKRSVRGRKSPLAKQRLETITAHLLQLVKTAAYDSIEDELQQFLSCIQVPDCQLILAHVTSELLTRCKNASDFYPQSALVQLVQTQGLSYSLCPELLAVALEKRDYCLLQLCLQHFPDIPEAVTCACLKAFLSVTDASLEDVNLDLGSAASYIDPTEIAPDAGKSSIVLQNGFVPTLLDEDCTDIQLISQKLVNTGESTPSCPVGLKKAALLNEILHSSYSEIFILPYLKDISAYQIILFLQYLHYLFEKCIASMNTELTGIRAPTVSQILDWISLLLDAHFTVLVMLPEVKCLLATLYKSVGFQVKFCSELGKMEGTLKEFYRTRQKNKDTGLYSIEVIELF